MDASGCSSLVRAAFFPQETLAAVAAAVPGPTRLSADEYNMVVRAFNAGAHLYTREKLVHELFEEQVRRNPNARAVVCDHQALTYARVNALANQLARHLRNQGVHKGALVGICLERGPDMVVALLAVLKAGGAYVPLDPNYPAERLRQMLEDAAPEVVLTEEGLCALLPDSLCPMVLLRETLQKISANVESDIAVAELGLEPQDLVYVIFTSGSTGRPKGTAMPHGAMVNLIEWHRRSFADREPSQPGAQCREVRVLQFAALSFDVAFQETFSTLCTGGTLVLLQEWVRRDMRALCELLSAQQIQRLFVPPLVLQALAECAQEQGPVPGYLRDVIAAGEALRVSEQVVHLFEQLPGCRLHNHYGPTETHVVTALTLDGAPETWPDLPSIGRPIANTQIYILDESGQPVPVGVVGEIHIGGAGVARGYLNRAALTQERFIPDPFSGDAEARLYKTGDLGRWHSDGTIQYLGRNDHQVKLRGFRIELGEIEAQLARHPLVREAAVIVREETPGQKRLVAYTTARGPEAAGAEQLRAHLSGLLPEYMLPSAFVGLDSLPLTPNGKLDRRALPAPQQESYASRAYVAPQGQIEEILAGIWQELLHVQRIGRQDNFFELGGHSLLIVQMMERLRRVGLGVAVRRVFQTPTLADLALALSQETLETAPVPPNLIPAGCAAITPQMLPLVSLEPAHIEHIVRAVPGGAANIQDIYPLAPLQEGMLFHHLLNDGDADPYVLSTLLRAASRRHLDDLIAALQVVIDRHDALRTSVLWEGLPQPVQLVHRRGALPIQESVLDADRDPVIQLEERIAGCRHRLDLRHAPLMGLEIAAHPQGPQWYAVLHTHHLVCDNESLKLLLDEVREHVADSSVQLPAAAAYREHVAQTVSRAEREDSETFFRQKLGDVDEPTLPFSIRDVRGDGRRLSEARGLLDPTLAGNIRGCARRLGVSAATVFHAAWAVVVACTSGRNDVVYGTVLLGRLQSSAGAQRMLGMFVNTLPLRIDLGKLGARALIEATQRELVDLLPHEQASLALARRCSALSGGAPLFTSLLNYAHSAPELERDCAGMVGIELLGHRGASNYPLVLSVDDQEDAFELTAQTDLRIDPARLLQYVREALRSLLSALELAPETPAVDLSILPGEERLLVLHDFNASEVEYPRGELIHELFERQVAGSPASPAVVCGSSQLSYTELNRKAERLACALRAHGVGPDDRVAVYAERGIDLVIGLLGTLKAGGAYVPLDPQLPQQRLAYILGDCGPKVVLTQNRLRTRLPTLEAPALILEEVDGLDETRLLRRTQTEITPSHLAYVIYTSGSTGQPKGVMIEHRSVINLIYWHSDAYGVRAGCQCSALAAVGFDASIWEILPPLSVGATLRIAPPEASANTEALLEWWVQQPLEVSFLPTPIAELVITRDIIHPTLRMLSVGGDSLRYRPAAAPPRLVNNYGPTESTVAATSGPIDMAETVLHIGKPIANTRIYILDPRQRPVPIGVLGELYIGGEGLARGYLNRTELTQERFVTVKLAQMPPQRLYRTGDLARWLPQGTIEFCGRNDDQVKIRGFRIELGEIETQLARHPAVSEVVVLTREEDAGHKLLVAYIVYRATYRPDPDVLRLHLKQCLPDYMIPAVFVPLEQLPLTANGKLDRRALPEPEMTARGSRRPYEPPSGDVEEAVAGVWRELLELERVGREDEFFELGGDSLLATKALARIRFALSMEIPMAALFECPTVRSLAARILELRRADLLEKIHAGGDDVEALLEKVASLSESAVRELVEAMRDGDGT